jgi:hypothetical protein
MSGPSLDAVLDTLLPGDADWPAGGALDLAATVAADVGADALRVLLDRLPPDFAAGDADRREAALRALETDQPEVFARLVDAAYLAYYTAARVRTVIERVTGYAARPPQPLGYELEPFDERLLDTQRQRAPFWRKA